VSQATLRTARLVLVPLADEHLEDEVALDADPEVMRYLGGRVHTRAEVVASHARRLSAAARVPGLGYWAGSVAGSFVGLWMLPPPTRPDQGPVEGQAELGYRLLRRWWRQGLASEGAAELLRHGFEDLGLQRVLAAVGLRYVRTFVLPFDEPLPGSEQGEVEYALTREQWLARGAAGNPDDTGRTQT
jgi:RimJ/RimL family protein N-acetyltransferase